MEFAGNNAQKTILVALYKKFNGDWIFEVWGINPFEANFVERLLQGKGHNLAIRKANLRRRRPRIVRIDSIMFIWRQEIRENHERIQNDQHD